MDDPVNPTTTPQLWCIERLECGVWDVVDTTDNEYDALLLASSYTELCDEGRLRISTPDFRFL